jgi:hypothetical protein
MVIACYRARAGHSAKLLDLVTEHATMLRSLGFITDRDTYLMEADDGTLVEVFEWASVEAKRAAHEHPEVVAMWDRFEELSESVPISYLPEADEVHPNFMPL